MNNESRPNLIISGIGSSGGGRFQLVKIDGIAKVSGAVECADFIVNGKYSSKGGVAGESIEINGDADVGGNVRADKLKIYGKAAINGSLSAEEIRVTGSLRVKGSCEAESFHTNGGFAIGGLLNAGDVDIILYDKCKVQEIGGETIRVRKHGVDLLKLLKSMFVTLSPKLTVESIEGDDIHLEYTVASVVRGSKVSIGAGCSVQRVEYKESIHLEQGAKVAHSVKL